MILLCNGDSWAQGDSPASTPNWNAKPNLDWYNIIPDFGELCNSHSDRVLYKFYDSNVWPKVLGKEFGVETWNCGRLGASNDKILRTTINSIEYLESLGKTDIFVVIGLTSINRYSNLTPKYTYDELRFESDNINPVLVQKNLVNLINIQNYLSMKGYDYLIFNVFDTLMEDDFKSLPLYQYIDFDKIYNNDLKAHFRNYIDNKFNTMWHVNGKHYQAAHPTDFSHIEWGNELHKYIKENYNV